MKEDCIKLQAEQESYFMRAVGKAVIVGGKLSRNLGNCQHTNCPVVNVSVEGVARASEREITTTVVRSTGVCILED